MCFSAEASFTVGSILTVIGAMCLKKSHPNKLKFVALIPLFFGIQQLCEGFVWLHLNGVLQNVSLTIAAQTLFLLFAWILWPVYIPFAFFIAEEVTWKKAICALCFLFGFSIFYDDYEYLIHNSVVATVVGNSIYYPATPLYGNIIYGIATMVPIFLSSVKNMWMFGACLLISFFATELIWTYTFTSVWCFFVAASSIILLKILVRDRETKMQTERIKTKF